MTLIKAFVRRDQNVTYVYMYDRYERAFERRMKNNQQPRKRKRLVVVNNQRRRRNRRNGDRGPTKGEAEGVGEISKFRTVPLPNEPPYIQRKDAPTIFPHRLLRLLLYACTAVVAGRGWARGPRATSQTRRSKSRHVLFSVPSAVPRRITL